MRPRVASGVGAKSGRSHRAPSVRRSVFASGAGGVTTTRKPLPNAVRNVSRDDKRLETTTGSKKERPPFPRSSNRLTAKHRGTPRGEERHVWCLERRQGGGRIRSGRRPHQAVTAEPRSAEDGCRRGGRASRRRSRCRRASRRRPRGVPPSRAKAGRDRYYNSLWRLRTQLQTESRVGLRCEAASSLRNTSYDSPPS